MGYFLGFDFDGTVADTFKPSPNKIGVKQAYDLSIADVFKDEGTRRYREIGGLANRAPAELAHQILNCSDREILIENAKAYFLRNSEYLTTQVSSNKGVPLVWNEQNPEKVIGELLVRVKLSHLLEQIGTVFPDGQKWPQPCTGFLELWRTIEALKKQGLPLTTAVISSGHDLFIEKVFEMWGLSFPDIMVTEDDIRGRHYPKELARRFKPGQLQLALAHRKWLETANLTGTNFVLEEAHKTRKNMIYFGDDPKKDGGLANDANIPFGWFNSENKPDTLLQKGIVFDDWQTIANILQENQQILREGRPIGEIFLPITSGGEIIGSLLKEQE